MEDAANSLRLALEREEAAHAHQEAAALRRSRELQRGFLSRLSHELRTPLTAIRGYASSLLQPDVTWDRDSQQRFLDRIAAESARLGRLVDDLLDFSAIESGTMRLQRDWCDIRLVIEAAIACLPPEHAKEVTLNCRAALPVVWADHDRMEQVFVNLLNNARPQPAGYPGPGERRGRAGRGDRQRARRRPGHAARAGRRPVRAGPLPARQRQDERRAPGSACPSPRASCRRTAAGSSWPRRPRAPASACSCRSRARSSRPPGRRPAALRTTGIARHPRR